VVQECLHRLVVTEKLEQARNRNASAAKDGDSAWHVWIAFDQLVEVHDRKCPPESAEAPRFSFRGPYLAPLPGHPKIFSIYDFAITLYDALVFDNPATVNAQLKLPQ